MFRNLSIKTRLAGVLALLSIQLVAGGILGVVSLGNANEAMKSMYDDRLVCMSQLDQVLRGLLRNEAILVRAANAEPARAAALAEQVKRGAADIDKAWNDYLGTSLTPDEQVLADAFAQGRRQYLDGAVTPLLAALHAGERDKAVAILNGPLETLVEPVRKSGNALIDLQLRVAKEEYRQAESTYELVRAIAVGGLALGLAIALAVGWWLVRAITVPLQQAVSVASSVAGGDLSATIEVRAGDETGRLMLALREMSGSLSRIVDEVRSGTETIVTASTEIAAGNSDLSTRTEQQAASLEETASSLEELTATVKQTADNARQARQLATAAAEVAREGGAVVQEVVGTMASIQKSSRRIADIIGVIDGIAFQTNILALNAAVEAARAGEQGRGFAVVAGEVRNLAQRSALASKEIRDLIQASVAKVDDGSRQVDRAGATMQEIVGSIARVNALMAEISVANQEQSDGIELINDAVISMEQATQQNAALVEQSAAASEALRDQADTLSRLVSVFKLGAAGVPPARISPAAPRLPA